MKMYNHVHDHFLYASQYNVSLYLIVLRTVAITNYKKASETAINQKHV